MPVSGLLVLCVIVASVAAGLAYRQAQQWIQEGMRLHSQPPYHAAWTALVMLLPAVALVVVWVLVEPWLLWNMVPPMPESAVMTADVWRDYVTHPDARYAEIDGPSHAVVAHYDRLQGISRMLLLVDCMGLIAWLGCRLYGRLGTEYPARVRVERALRLALAVSALCAVLVTVAIVLSVAFEAVQFFKIVPPGEFLFGIQWSPQMAMRADQAGSSGSFGAVPLFMGTLLITAIAMAVALPVGVMAAIYMSEYACNRTRNWGKPLLEILAGIPTVVYGYFAAIIIAPAIRAAGEAIGLSVASESALAAGLVMGVMIIPFVSSLSDDVIHAVPQSLRDGGYAMGSTRSETICRIVIPAAAPGLVGAALLAVSRAIGETMIVVMAAGLAANLTLNPLEAVTTVTAQIVSLLVGDQEFDSPKTLAAFALGLTLFLCTLALNVVALKVVKNYRSRYAA